MTCREMTTLMARCEERAWGEFHTRYYRWLFGLAISRCSPEMDEAEVVQLTLLRAVRHVRRIDDEGELRKWLSCLMKCVVIDAARKIKRRHLFIEKWQLWRETRDLSQEKVAQDVCDHLKHALNALGGEDRSLVSLKYFEGWTTYELAAKFEKTPKAIENQLARARKMMKTRLQADSTKRQK